MLMSPFAEYFHQLRFQHGISQTELAIQMGYEQTYISAVELDKKGPPTEHFIQKFVKTLDLSHEQHLELSRRANASNRKFKISAALTTQEYWLVNELKDKLGHLSEAQISAIRSIIAIQDRSTEHSLVSNRSIRKRGNQEATM